MRTIVVISIIISVVASNTINAQQIPTLSQYMENTYLINPAAAGTNLASPISLHYKHWWSGFNEAPTMQAITGTTQLSQSVGIGGKIFNYATGPISKLGVEGTYAYHFSVGSSSKIALGLSAQLYQFYLNKSLLRSEEQDDQAILSSSDKIITPDAAFGAYYYGSNYYAGLSVYQLFNRKAHLMNSENIENRQVRHYFFTAGYRYDINDNFSVEPSVLAKYIETGIFQLDANLRGWYQQMIWLGFSYRTSESAIVSVGLKKDRFCFGYAYDMPLSDLKAYSVGSHELLFAIYFNQSRTKLATN